MYYPSGQAAPPTTTTPDPYAPATPVQYTGGDYAGYGAVGILGFASGCYVGKTLVGLFKMASGGGSSRRY